MLLIPDHYSSTPLLQQPWDLRTGFWPPSEGLQTKPRPPGVDSSLLFCHSAGVLLPIKHGLSAMCKVGCFRGHCPAGKRNEPWTVDTRIRPGAAIQRLGNDPRISDKGREVLL